MHSFAFHLGKTDITERERHEYLIRYPQKIASDYYYVYYPKLSAE